jgi:hypothetical protein
MSDKITEALIRLDAALKGNGVNGAYILQLPDRAAFEACSRAMQAEIGSAQFRSVATYPVGYSTWGYMTFYNWRIETADSCDLKRHSHEPKFVLLGRDSAAVPTLLTWVNHRKVEIMQSLRADTPQEHAHIARIRDHHVPAFSQFYVRNHVT